MNAGSGHDMSLFKGTYWSIIIISVLYVHFWNGELLGAQEQSLPVSHQEQLIVVDKEKKIVRLKGWITTRRESHHCGIGWAGGSNGSGAAGTKFLFETRVKPEEVFEALAAIGKKPGNNLSRWKRSTPVQGDPITISVDWPGAERHYELSELVQDAKGAELQFRFGGNLKAAKKHKTGCIACFTSCYVAIVSNAKVVLSERKEHDFHFTYLAPPSGAEVELIFQ